MDPTTTTTTTSDNHDNRGPKDPFLEKEAEPWQTLLDPPKDPPNIIKGKRTKRPRPTILTHSSTSYNPSPTSSSDFPATSTTTEDEDTANCLILLSKGHFTHNTNKFISKKFIQTSTDTDATNGLTLTKTYVYECKTCTRTFTSFQALGGHRASHKKPRIIESEKRTSTDEDEHEPSSVSHNIHQPKKSSSSKVHECSICGAEFNSGQALGGHMRRHRGNIIAANTTLSLIPYSPVTTSSVVADDRDYQKSTNDGLCLDLDLNLPAPTLVDCHF